MDATFRRAVEEARRQDELCFASLLPEGRIEEALGATRVVWQGWVYTPAVTVWVFLAQSLSPDHSCREAVARLIAWRVASGQKACSAQTGAYCTARDSLPEEACAQLMRDTGRQVDEEAPPEWRWRGRRVLDVDDSTVTMPDTPDNQTEYPQLSSQQRGCGFPIARIVVVFSLAVGTVLDAAIGRYQGKQTGENSLFRTLHDLLQEGDVVLADRDCVSSWRRAPSGSGWFDLALLQQRSVDVLVRKHQLRPTDFRTGQRLGPGDHLVCRKKPQRPTWMSQEQYAALPQHAHTEGSSRAGRTERLPHQKTGAGDHLARPRSISRRRDRRVLPPTLASRTPLEKLEDRVANGPPPLQDAAPGSQRILDAPVGVQSDPTRHDRHRLPRRRGTMDHQFQRHPANTEHPAAPVE